jgi:hypothetical protein
MIVSNHVRICGTFVLMFAGCAIETVEAQSVYAVPQGRPSTREKFEHVTEASKHGQPGTNLEEYFQKANEKKEKSSDQYAEEQERFISDFLQMSPQDRVRLWENSNTWKNRNTMAHVLQGEMLQALVAVGTDAVPYLLEVARKERGYLQIGALETLCDMDRFVADKDLPFRPGVGPIHIRPLGISGTINKLQPCDGRRIGKEASEFIRRAAEQEKNKELRFHARECLGLIEKDLRQLSIEGTFQRWQQALIRSKGGVASGNYDESRISEILAQILIERGPDSLPQILDLLEHNSNPYLREGALHVLVTTDSCRMRLRGTELGRRAIEAIRHTLETGSIAGPALQEKSARDNYWKLLSQQFFDDDLSTWTWDLARSLEAIYGEKLTIVTHFGMITHVEATPEMRRFVTFLTNVDPYFPSWEYTNCGLVYDQVLFPNFKAKMDRYHEQWVRFHSGNKPSVANTEPGSGP